VLSARDLLRNLPRLIEERDSLKDHLKRLNELLKEYEGHVAKLSEERDLLHQHVARLGLLAAPPGSYGSPIVDPRLPEVRRAVEAQARWQWNGTPLDLDEPAMLALFHRLSAHYAEAEFPDERTPGSRYYFRNPAFTYADAITLFCMMREFRPKRIVEAGAGFSSCLMMDANDRFFGGAIDLISIDPYPDVVLGLLEPDDPYRSRIRTLRLQDAELEIFERLEENDILFIDSSHIAKTGSDVTDYMFRILPALRPGAIVQIHDILYPFEHPAAWALEENRSWNEAYFLRAFLQDNPRFRLIYFNDWIYNAHGDLTEQHMPRCRRQTGGSVWLRRI
jgi:predicted O-methyltransferase YrrM